MLYPAELRDLLTGGDQRQSAWIDYHSAPPANSPEPLPPLTGSAPRARQKPQLGAEFGLERARAWT